MPSCATPSRGSSERKRTPSRSSSGRRSTRTSRARRTVARTSRTSSRAWSWSTRSGRFPPDSPSRRRSTGPDRERSHVSLTAVVVLVVVIAFAFDVINGFHDAANSIATVVSTRVLKPQIAVLWAAFFNFVAMFVFAPKVADTISKIVRITPDDRDWVYVVLAGLIGAIVWDLVTWFWALPTSSSHALIGGFAGAGVAHAGWDVLRCEKLLETFKFIPLAPLLGCAMGVLLMLVVYWVLRRWRPASVDHLFRRLQLISAALYSLGHGGNDAQKTMGIIVALL